MIKFSIGLTIGLLFGVLLFTIFINTSHADETDRPTEYIFNRVWDSSTDTLRVQ